MGAKQRFVVAIVIFATLPRLVATEPEPGLRSRSLLDQEQNEHDFWAQKTTTENLQEKNDDYEKEQENQGFVDNTLTINIFHGPGPEPAINQKLEKTEFYLTACETNSDCKFVDFKGMECRERKCQCKWYEKKYLKYDKITKKCLGNHGHSCTHDEACYNRNCVKALRGKRWADGNYNGKCEGYQDISWNVWCIIVGLLGVFWFVVVVIFIITCCCLSSEPFVPQVSSPAVQRAYIRRRRRQTDTEIFEEVEEIEEESVTEVPSESLTEPPTESTESPTEPPTKPPTESPTKPPTESPTKSPTESPTKPSTETPSTSTATN